MKTKEEILKMSKEELKSYKWNNDLNIKREKKDTNFNCSDNLFCKCGHEDIEHMDCEKGDLLGCGVLNCDCEKFKKELGDKR